VAEILATTAQVTARLRRFGENDLVALELYIFLDHDGVGALGHGRAGENAHGGCRSKLARRVAAAALAAQRQDKTGGHQVGGAHGIAVHGGIIERGVVHLRAQFPRGETAMRLRQRHRLCRGGWRDFRENGVAGLFQVSMPETLTHFRARVLEHASNGSPAKCVSHAKTRSSRSIFCLIRRDFSSRPSRLRVQKYPKIRIS
jgi:hypothetical protein